MSDELASPKGLWAAVKKMLDRYERPYELLPPPFPGGPPGFRFDCGCGFRLEGETGERDHYMRCDDPSCTISQEVEETARDEAKAAGLPLNRRYRYMRPRGRAKRRKN